MELYWHSKECIATGPQNFKEGELIALTEMRDEFSHCYVESESTGEDGGAMGKRQPGCDSGARRAQALRELLLTGRPNKPWGLEHGLWCTGP